MERWQSGFAEWGYCQLLVTLVPNLYFKCWYLGNHFTKILSLHWLFPVWNSSAGDCVTVRLLSFPMYLPGSFSPKGQYIPAVSEAYLLKLQLCIHWRRWWGNLSESVISLALFSSTLFQSSLLQFHCLEPWKVLTEFAFKHYVFLSVPTNSWNELTPRLLPLHVLIWRCWYSNKNMNLKQAEKLKEEIPG